MISSFVTLLRRELWEQHSLRWIPLLLLLFVLLANLAFMYAAGGNAGFITIESEGRGVSPSEILDSYRELGARQDGTAPSDALV